MADFVAEHGIALPYIGRDLTMNGLSHAQLPPANVAGLTQH
jgi:hypothetical protein